MYLFTIVENDVINSLSERLAYMYRFKNEICNGALSYVWQSLDQPLADFMTAVFLVGLFVSFDSDRVPSALTSHEFRQCSHHLQRVPHLF